MVSGHANSGSSVKHLLRTCRYDLQYETTIPASIFYKSISDRYRPVRVADGPITARYRFIKNAYSDLSGWIHKGRFSVIS